MTTETRVNSAGVGKTLWCLKQTDGAVKHKQTTNTNDHEHDKEKKFLRCAACHSPVTQQENRIRINEQHEHVFANPHGYIYHIGCFDQAPGCLTAGEETEFFSWFPGYSWQIALCGQCLVHLGWAFRSQNAFFFGLILEKLTEKM